MRPSPRQVAGLPTRLATWALMRPAAAAPARHWALAIPLWLLLAAAYVYWAYEG
jgi:hypothetical protein